jgi:putative ABC transport system ATP-binding protein
MQKAGVLELDRVAKHYHDVEEVVHAVDDVSLTIAAGEVSVLYGPSGSGKTTVLLLAAGLISPDTGTIRFAGADLAALDANALSTHHRKRIGFVYQTPHLMSGVPATENAAVKLLADGVALRQARQRAISWLDRVGLGHRLEHTPEQLSGGERQRVAIARALVGQPQLILADEPTGNLDTRRSREILELLAAIAREEHAAVLLATHDPHAASIASHVHVLSDGKLVHSRHGAGDARSLAAVTDLTGDLA